jgi:hypothetical protein
MLNGGWTSNSEQGPLPFPINTRNELVNSGRVSPHHVLPQSGWISYWITQGENDIPSIVELFRI